MSKSRAGETDLALINELHRLELRLNNFTFIFRHLRRRSAEAQACAAELAMMHRQINRIKAQCCVMNQRSFSVPAIRDACTDRGSATTPKLAR
jgi:hypothetical protein